MLAAPAGRSRFAITAASVVPGANRAEVHFCEEQNPRIEDREVCEVVLHGAGRPVQCRAAAPDGFAAMHLAASKLQQQLARAKERPGGRAGARVASRGNGRGRARSDGRPG